MTTFDGSGAPAAPTDPSPQPGVIVDEYEELSGFDAFEALRDQVEERDEEDPDTTEVEIPGIGWRLICRTDFEYGKYKNWQKAALPKNQRNGRKLNPLDMDQALLAHLVLFNTCEAVEYRRKDGDWRQLTDPDGQPATLQSGTFMERMGVMDPRLLTKRLFGRDGRLIAAGQRVIVKAGFGESDGDAEDPTD